MKVLSWIKTLDRPSFNLHRADFRISKLFRTIMHKNLTGLEISRPLWLKPPGILDQPAGKEFSSLKKPTGNIIISVKITCIWT